MVPIGQTEHQSLAQRNDPIISIGQPKAHPNSAAGFLRGSAGPRKRKANRMKKNGVAALRITVEIGD